MHTAERFTSLAVGVLVSLAAGTVYIYGIYSPQLVSHIGLTASDSATISLATNLGSGCGGLPGGYVIDHWGPQKAIVAGSLCIFAGYYAVYLMYEHTVKALLLICVAMTGVGFGSITSYFACLKAAQANFPKHRGAAGAAPISAYGLSGTLFSLIATVWFGHNTGGLLQFLSLFCGLLAFVGSFFVHVYLDEDDELGMDHTDTEVGTALWAGDGATSETSTLADFPGQTGPTTPFLPRQESQSSLSAAVPSAKKSIDPIDVIKRRLANWWYLMHFIAVSLGAGIGQMYIFSVGFVVTAQCHYNNDTDAIHRVQALQVSLISMSSFGGRVLAGFLSDYIHKTHGYSRLWLSVLTCFTLASGQLISAVNVADPFWLSVASTLIGCSYGLVFGTYPAVIADQFGTRTFSTTWGLTCVGPFFTLFVLNKVFGWIYDAHAVDGVCELGNGCYKPVFQGSFALCFVMLVVTVYVIYARRTLPSR
ncbi:hypothetical protein DICA0_A08152 [Diutina catenulata]